MFVPQDKGQLTHFISRNFCSVNITTVSKSYVQLNFSFIQRRGPFYYHILIKLDSFTIPLHSPHRADTWRIWLILCKGLQMASKSDGNAHGSHTAPLLTQSRIDLEVYTIYMNSQLQKHPHHSEAGHVSYPTNSPTANRLKLCNSLATKHPAIFHCMVHVADMSEHTAYLKWDALLHKNVMRHNNKSRLTRLLGWWYRDYKYPT